VGVYQAVVTTNGSGDGTNLDSLGNPLWSGHFRGELMGIRIEFGASPAAGTDTTLSEITGLKRTLHTFTDTAAAANAFPAAAIAGATDAFLPHYVDSSNLKVTVAQGGDTKTVYLTALVKEC
jgi:hypothetical protein